MKRKFFLLILTIFLVVLSAFAAEDHVIRGGVSIDKVPKELYGSWRVTSSLASTNSDGLFKKNNVDLWNLSRSNNVITLENPFTGAQASIIIDEVRGKLIKFKKIGNYDGKKLTDTVQLILGKDSFAGTNTLKLDTISEIDGHVIKSETAVYELLGEKISGSSIE